MQTLAGSALGNHVTLTFDLLTFGSVHAERLPCTMSTNFVVDSSNRFPFTARTHRHTHSHRRHWSLYPHIGCRRRW